MASKLYIAKYNLCIYSHNYMWMCQHINSHNVSCMIKMCHNIQYFSITCTIVYVLTVIMSSELLYAGFNML